MKTSNKRTLKKGNRLPACIVCVLLAGVVWVAFSQTLGHDFVNYDDNDYVYENPQIIHGLSASGVKWAFTHVHAANWHPLTTISHMLDVQVYGLQPWGHHLTNVLLHATAAILLFLALRNLTLSIWPSAFVAALFAIHPLRVESVAWISERKDLLSGVFCMLTLLAYARYVRSDRDRFSSYAIVVALFALGLMCKPTLVTLPFVLLLLDYWPLRRWQVAGSTELAGKGKDQNRKSKAGKVASISRRDLLVEKIPLFVLSITSCVVTLLAQHEALQKSLHVAFIERAANAVASYATYLGQMFYPAHLAVLYPYSKVDLKITRVILDLGLLLAISAICFLWRRKYPFLTIGWLWYLGMLVPMIGIVQVGVQAHGDRYTYLPQIGLYIAIAWGAVELFKQWRVRPAIVTIVASIPLIALTACTYREASFWQNGETLWKHAIENGSGSSVAYYSLGTLFLRQGQLDAALTEFENALQADPDNAEAQMNAGVALLQKGDLNGAINRTEKALQIDPGYFEAEYNLGNLLQQRGQPGEAIPHYRKALVSKPAYPEAHNSLGVALAQNGELDPAIAEFKEAVRLRPDYAEAHSDLGNALASQHKFDQAIPQHLEALRLHPNSPQARYNLGYTLLQAGRREEAIVQFNEALRLNSGYTEARDRLRELGIPGSP